MNLRRDNGDSIQFRHELVPNSYDEPVNALGLGPRHRTYCHIVCPDAAPREWRSWATYDTRDKFDLEKGRRAALKNALKMLSQPFHQRFWSLYFSRSPRFTNELSCCNKKIKLAVDQPKLPFVPQI